MHHYRREMAKQDRGYELKLEPNAQCVHGQSLVDLHPAFQRLEDLMRILGYSLTDILSVQISIREAAANAVRHGSQGDPSRRVEVRFLVTQDEVVVEVEDEGPGFDPTQVPDPLKSGAIDRFKRLGLFMMRAHMNWVHFNARGNRVTLGRRRSVL